MITNLGSGRSLDQLTHGLEIFVTRDEASMGRRNERSPISAMDHHAVVKSSLVMNLEDGCGSCMLPGWMVSGL